MVGALGSFVLAFFGRVCFGCDKELGIIVLQGSFRPFLFAVSSVNCVKHLVKANCATTKSTFCVMPSGFFGDLHLDKPISWHIGHFTGHACGGPLAKEFWPQFWQTFPRCLAFLLPRFQRGILATGLVKWVK